MDEVLIRYDTVLRGRDGRTYGVQACGRARADGMWEGWLEFLPADGTDRVASARETSQPNRDDLVYWATGLTDAYLDGALLRTLTPTEPARPATPAPTPYDEPGAPAPSGTPDRPVRTSAAPARTRSGPPAAGTSPPAAGTSPQPASVLDPFQVYAEGEHVLRGQLGALDAGHLRNMIRAHQLSPLSAERLEPLSRDELAAMILDAVRARARP
jgi:hypothetical protein